MPVLFCCGLSIAMCPLGSHPWRDRPSVTRRQRDCEQLWSAQDRCPAIRCYWLWAIMGVCMKSILTRLTPTSKKRAFSNLFACEESCVCSICSWQIIWFLFSFFRIHYTAFDFRKAKEMKTWILFYIWKHFCPTISQDPYRLSIAQRSRNRHGGAANTSD